MSHVGTTFINMGLYDIICMIVFVFFVGEKSSGTTINIQTINPIIFRNPESSGSDNKANLFGTSIGLAENSESIFVGAPKFSYGGGVYRCDISTPKDCNILNGFDRYGKL